MEVRFAPNAESCQRLTTEELRKNFLIENLFEPGTINLTYSDVDRAIIGGIVPTNQPLQLVASKKEMAADYFFERREGGIINVGGKGSISVDGKKYPMETKDVLYVGKRSNEVLFSSQTLEQPARFFLMSYPAHKDYPTTHAKFSDAEPQHLGSQKDANRRTIYKYIHMNGIKSCQLVMGMTELEEGSVWNTMPAHTHLRRSEVYMYFNMRYDAVVFHFMGEPIESRNLVVKNNQAVISPSWSIHCGAGTSNYSFVWAMGGENQEFSDMDAVPIKDMR
ncbi:MAG: 5-dehydro-4-deoxy-D-glucuronate isomerase [Bacteroidota bacterium]